MSRSSSSSSAIFSCSPPAGVSNSPSESDSLSEVELELACDPDPNPDGDTKVEEDQPCVQYDSESPPDPKVEPKDTLAPGGKRPMDACAAAQKVPELSHCPKTPSLVEGPATKPGEMPGAQAEPMAGSVEGGLRVKAESKEVGGKEVGDAGPSRVEPDIVDREVRVSQCGDKSIVAMNGSDNLDPEENPLEDGEIRDLGLSEEEEIVDIDPEPLTKVTLDAVLGARPMLYNTSKDQCLHWLGRMRGEVMEEDDLFEKTWLTDVWITHFGLMKHGLIQSLLK
ncbi:hypothetical protein FRC11_005470 [Ceratobasidium sp. 423]|nr:hypothetical protein FRC11_005470 [Ceratobasidium sp. 423]